MSIWLADKDLLLDRSVLRRASGRGFGQRLFATDTFNLSKAHCLVKAVLFGEAWRGRNQGLS